VKKARRTHTAPTPAKRRGLKRLLFPALLLAAAVTAAAAGGAFNPGSAAAQDEAAGARISPEALKQIQALVLDKMSRTPAQRKIDSQLLYAAKMSRGESVAAGVQTLSVAVDEAGAGRVVVDITAKLDDAFFETLRANGGRVLVAVPGYDSVRAEIGLDRVEAVAALPQVRYVQSKQEAYATRPAAAPAPPSADRPLPAARPSSDFKARAERVRSTLKGAIAALASDAPVEPVAGTNVGARQSQGDITHRANIARSRYGVDGTGVKIGVLSDGVVNMSAAVNTGDLPPDVTVLPGQVGQGDEGTAMLEIVHDLAPGAKLYFASAFSSITSFADNIRKLRAAGCDIIVDDIFYYVEAPLQDGQTPGIVSNTNGGVVTQAVNDVTAAGALYFSSAGNEGNKNDGTSGVFEGDFTNGGTLALIGGAGAGPVHDFDPSGAVSQFDTITFGSGNPITCAWADPLGGSNNDYDLYVLNDTGSALVAASTGSQDGTQDPLEIVGGGANATGNRIVVAKFSGADRYLHVNTFRGRLQFNTPGQTHGHASAAEAYAVAATPAVGPFPQPFNSSNQVETFESDGPRRLFFRPDGTPYTPGNFSSTGGIVRQKPDITAADGGVISGAGGFSNPFFGTSAAAPHAAAITALLLDGKPGITPAQVRAALVASAIDIESPGVDRDSGVGIIMADTALAAAGAPAVELELGTVTATESAGNGNGFVEPGERGSLTVQLRNNSAAALTNVSATLTSSTPGVTIIPPGTSAYPDIAPGGGTATNTTPFQFVVSSSVASPSTISFTLTVTYSGGTSSPQTFNFTIPVGRSVTVSTTLDTTPPPGGEGYTATTGLQSGRLGRTGFNTNSSCGINKPNPNINAADAGTPHRYDAYTFQNNSGQTICVTITLTTSAADANRLQSAAYAPTFDPAHVSDNYLGDISNNQTGVASRTYSVNVPANTSFVVVVNEVAAGGGVGTAYTLTVGGLPRFTAPASLVSLQFQQANTQVQEACAGLTLTVTRTGDTSFPVTVDYSTVDGTASSRSDYTKALGTLSFAAGQTSATIPLLVSEDSYTEGTEQFTVALSNPQGLETGVGATGVATVQILDDAPESATNPIDDTETFVCQHYHDFLNREPDDSGLAFWKSQIDSCTTDACRADRRVQVSAAFFLSIEFQQTGFLVHRIYQESYGRRIGGTVPLTFDEFLRDTQRIGRDVIVGQGNWQQQLDANKAAFALEFVQRPEFLAVYPRSMNAAQFVDALNANTGGALVTTDRDRLVAALAANNTDDGRASILRLIADYPTFFNSEFNRAFVLAEYFGYLRRNPNDPPDGNFNGYNFWLSKLDQFNGDFNKAEMVKAFLSSNEYRQRFGN
jgi:hypothetical protein